MQARGLRRRPFAAGQYAGSFASIDLVYILAAIGYADVDALDVNRLRVWLAGGGREYLVAENGGRAASYSESDGARIMRGRTTVRVELERGPARAAVDTLRPLLRLCQDQRRLPQLAPLCGTTGDEARTE